MSNIKFKQGFMLNLPDRDKSNSHIYRPACLGCGKTYETIHAHQKYCRSPCLPLTERQKTVEGITDAVRRGEAVAVPIQKEKPKARRKKVTKDLGEMSRRMLSMKL